MCIRDREKEIRRKLAQSITYGLEEPVPLREALSDLQAALGDYQEALVIAPNFAAAHYNAARLHAKRGDLDECLAHLEKAVEFEPSLRNEAARDDNLGWVLKLRSLKDNQER